MTIQSSSILLKNVRFFARHGVLPQERIVGGDFILNLRLDTDFRGAMESDDIKDTISYADAYEVVKSEMAIPSASLEHVAGRICRALFARFPEATSIHLELLKENPPMGADGDGAGVSLDVNR